jgi:23S rRNA (cytidine2498-2'-O)-methyltransferase
VAAKKGGLKSSENFADSLKGSAIAKRIYVIRDSIRDEFLDEARENRVELKQLFENIYLSENGVRLYWVLDTWVAEELQFVSISDATAKLRKINPKWSYVGGVNFRRGKLIADGLRVREPSPIGMSEISARRPWLGGVFTLGDQNMLYYGNSSDKGIFAGGKIAIVEDRTGPPSRAYLKLCEVLQLTSRSITQADSVLDLGATPGGWSFVAATLGARVEMVDRSPPDAGLLRRFPHIRFHKGDGLNPPPELLRSASVILSDMACEPAKLLISVLQWLKESSIQLMVCTLKFHGKSDKALIRQFANIEGSRIYHLSHNGHELTWVWER